MTGRSDSDALLRVRGLTVAPTALDRRAPVLDDVQFDIARDECLAIVGESGCGKSVTLAAIVGLLGPGLGVVAGEAWFEGRDLLKLNDRQLSQVRGKKIGFVFQEPASALHPAYTIQEQISEAIRLHDRISRREAKERALEWLSRVKIADPRRVGAAFPHELSGGMRQRALIAMALAPGPQILFADEPTTALDAPIQAHLLDLLGELRQRHHIALVLVSHDLSLVATIAERTVVLYAGHVVEAGATETLLHTPQHPYTEALLAAMPQRNMRPYRELGKNSVPLPHLPGGVPAPEKRGSICRLLERCTRKVARCGLEPVSLRPVDNVLVRCHLAPEDSLTSQPDLALRVASRGALPGEP